MNFEFFFPVNIYRGEALRHAFVNCVFNYSNLGYVEATSLGGRNSVPHLQVNTKLEVWQSVRYLLTLHDCHTVLMWFTTMYINRNYVNVTIHFQICINVTIPFPHSLQYWHAKSEVLRKNGYDSGDRSTHKTSPIATLCTTNPSKREKERKYMRIKYHGGSSPQLIKESYTCTVPSGSRMGV